MNKTYGICALVAGENVRIAILDGDSPSNAPVLHVDLSPEAARTIAGQIIKRAMDIEGDDLSGWVMVKL